MANPVAVHGHHAGFRNGKEPGKKQQNQNSSEVRPKRQIVQVRVERGLAPAKSVEGYRLAKICGEVVKSGV